MANRYLWEILVPTVMSTEEDPHNNRKPIRIAHHRQWDKVVLRITGGLTVMTPTIKGCWVSHFNDVVSDRCIPVRIYCTRNQIQKIAHFTISHYRQEAVMFYKIADEVCILNKEKEHGPSD